MDITALTSSPILPTQTSTQAVDTAAALPATTVASPAFEVSYTSLMPASTDLQAQVAASSAENAAASSELQAEDILAQATQIQQTQQAVVAALTSGQVDSSLLRSGLPPGATATLLGGGWVRLPPGADAVEAEAIWAFHIPFRKTDVPAVDSPNRTPEARDQDKRPARKTPLAGYGRHGEEEPEPGAAPSLDILD